MLKIHLHPDNPYVKESKEIINTLYPNLWTQLDKSVELLGEEEAKKLLSFALDYFGSSHTSNIEIGRYIILSMPREWVLHNIHELVLQKSSHNDDWMFQRIMEMYALLESEELMKKIVAWGKESQSEDIQKEIKDYEEDPEAYNKKILSFYRKTNSVILPD